MAERIRVVFVSRRNSLRSVLAAACLAHLDSLRFGAHSCGAPGHLASATHPAAIAALASAKIQVPGGSPVSWDTLLRGTPLQTNFLIVLDETIAPLVPSWRGQPDIATWPFPDVAAMADADQARHAATQLLYLLRRRLELLIALTMRSSDRTAIQSDVRDLANMD